METEIQETELYKKFKKALNITQDMRPGPNPFVVACCEIAKEYAQQSPQAIPAVFCPECGVNTKFRHLEWCSKG